MVKYYCDFCDAKVNKDDEYSLPIEYETGFAVSTLTYSHMLPNREIMYLPEKCHICKNCAKIIYLFIKGMKKKGDTNE